MNDALAVAGIAVGKVAAGLAIGAVGVTLAAQPASAAPARHEAPIGYHFDVSTANLYMMPDLRHEDGRPGTWNAAERGNHRGVSFFTTKHPHMTIHLGVNDRAQGGDASYSGLAAWRKHGTVRVSDHNRSHGEGVYRLHGYVAEVDATVQTGGRTFYVIANAIWK